MNSSHTDREAQAARSFGSMHAARRTGSAIDPPLRPLRVPLPLHRRLLEPRFERREVRGLMDLEEGREMDLADVKARLGLG